MKSITMIAVEADSKKDAKSSVEMYVDDNVDLSQIECWSVQSVCRVSDVIDKLREMEIKKEENSRKEAKEIASIAQEYIDGKTITSYELWEKCKEYYLGKSSHLTPYKGYHNINAEYDSDGIPDNPEGWYIVNVLWKH